MEKKSINIVVSDNTEATNYITLLSNIFDITVLTHKEAFAKKRPQIDLVLYTDGESINPGIYNQDQGQFVTNVNDKRDSLERNVFYDLPRIPRLGIGRGAQLLAALSGSSLIQHVTGHSEDHLVTVEGYGSIMLPSSHTQMIYPFNQDDSNYRLIGYATNFRSSTYLNDRNEEIKLKNSFVEPEIIEYPNSHSLCFQGNLENPDIDKYSKDVVLAVIKEWFDKKTMSKPSSSSQWYTLPDTSPRFIETQVSRRSANMASLLRSQSDMIMGSDSFNDTTWHTTRVDRPFTMEEVRPQVDDQSELQDSNEF